MADIVIIGNGAAGNSVAETIRRLEPDLSIIIVTQDSLPQYSVPALPDYLSGWVRRHQLFIKGWQDYHRMRLEILADRSQVRIDTGSRSVLTEQEVIPYGRLVLATGSRPFIPPIPGAQLPGNFSIKTIADIDALMEHRPQRTVVIGSGNIGVEMAQALHYYGSRVTLIEMQDQVLPRILDPEPARRVREILQAGGIEVLTGERAKCIGGQQRVEEVVTERLTIPGDTVVWASGMRANVQLAQEAGISIGARGGIQVDEYLQTSCPGIYACGDCIEPLDMLTGQTTVSMLWPNAKRQGEVAAMNCIGRSLSYEGSFNMVTDEVLGIPVVSLGLPTNALALEQVRLIEGESRDGYWRIIVSKGRIMGAQAIGVTAGLGALTAMIKCGLTLDEYDRMTAEPGMAGNAAWLLPALPLLAPRQSREERFFQ